MSRRQKSILIIVSGMALVALLAFLLFGSVRRPVSWRETYKESSNQPYGSQFLFQLLERSGQFAEVVNLSDSIRGELPAIQKTPAAYVFVGEAIYMDTSDRNSLMRFVSEGNTAFISSKILPYDLMFYLYDYECEGEAWAGYEQLIDSLVWLELDHPRLKLEQPIPLYFQVGRDTTNYYWSLIPDLYFCDAEGGLVPLGRFNEEYVNFARVSYGDGYFYLHSTPLALSNISLQDSLHLEYVEKLLSHLPRQGILYWDSYSRVPESVGRRMNNDMEAPSRRIDAESPLKYVLSQPPLAWGWYLMLGLGLLYLLFRAKRRQRIIPVLEPNTNTSLEFVSTIGRLHFLQSNHRQLCRQKTRLFLSFVRHRYGLHLRDLDPEGVKKLAAYSNIQEDHIKDIATLARNVESSSIVTENSAIRYHQLLDHFYKNCK